MQLPPYPSTAIPPPLRRWLENLVRALLPVPRFLEGTGTPEGAVVGGVGDRFYRLDGGVGTTLYYKSTATGNTGWVAHG